MSVKKSLRFGVQVRGASSRQEWQQKARKAEAMGYSSLVVPDHLAGTEVGSSFGPFPSLMSAAEATERIHLGTLVIDNDFRHPLVLAQDASTLDVLSEGRLELGIGAGWMGSDYSGSGIALDRPGVRVARLAESVQILKKCFSGEKFSHDGSYYQISDHQAFPVPMQKPHPTLLIGGGGKRMLSLAAHEADIVNIFVRTAADGSGPILSDASPTSYRKKLGLVRTEAGSRFDDLEIGVLIQYVEVTNDRMRVASEHAEHLGLSVDEMLDVPFELIGTPDQIAEDIVRRRDSYGISYLIVFEKDMDIFADIMGRL